MEVGQSLCSWLVAVVDSWEGSQVSKHHWEMVTRMVGRVASGSVPSEKSLMSLLRPTVLQEVGQMANARAQALLGMLNETHLIGVGGWRGWLFQEKMRGKLGSSKSIQ